jgi:phosphoribosylformylglycinamidine synthase II
LSSPNIASKRWVFEQYDHMVQTNTVTAPGQADAAVIRIKGLEKGIAATSDCNSRYCYLDPYIGAQIAVAEAARNLVCTGADPAAVTDCLNFGKPEKADRFWQLKRGVEGIADACKMFNVPVVSGNVSLYNEGPEAAVFPTPTIGMVGVLDNVDKNATMSFKRDGDLIILLGSTRNELGGSEYLAVKHGKEEGYPPMLNFRVELGVQNTTLAAIRADLVSSAHDCSEGGIAVAIAESAITGGKGAVIDIEAIDRVDTTLFAESQSRIILTANPANANAIQAIAEDQDIPFTVIGTVGGTNLKISIDGEECINLPVEKIANAFYNPIYNAMGE